MLCPSTAAGWATACRLRFGLSCANERAQKLTIHLWRNRVDINSLPRQKLPGVFGAVDAGRLNLYLVESGGNQLVAVIIFFEGYRHATHPRHYDLSNLE